MSKKETKNEYDVTITMPLWLATAAIAEITKMMSEYTDFGVHKEDMSGTWEVLRRLSEEVAETTVTVGRECDTANE